MFKRFYILGIFTFLIFSCTDKKRIQFSKTIELEFPVPKNDILDIESALFTENNNEYIAFASFKKKSIGLLNLANNQTEYIFPLDSLKNDIDTISDIGFGFNFHLYNRDSLFAILYVIHRSILLLDDNKGIKKYDINETIASNFELSATYDTPLLFLNKYIVVKRTPYLKAKGIDYRKQFYNISPDILIDISKNPAKSESFGKWPDHYHSENYYDTYPSRCIGYNDNIVYSYGADHNLYLYKSFADFEKKNAKSKFISNFTPFNDDSVGNIPYIKKYYATNPRYIKVVYDKYRQYYYRIAEHESTLLDEKEQSMRSVDAKPWSLIIFDKNLNYIDEVFFPENSEFIYYYFMVTKDGILIKNKQKDGNDYGNYKWKAGLFKINI